MKKLLILVVTFFVMAQLACAVDIKLLNTDPYPLESGELGKIRIKLTAKNLPDGIKRDSGFKRMNIEFVDTSIKLVDESRRSQTFVLKESHSQNYYQVAEYEVMVGNVPEGGIPVQFKISGDEEEKQRVHVPVTDNSPEFAVGHVISSPDDLYPDSENNKLKVQVTNIGDDMAKNVNARINSSAFVPSGSLSNYYGLGGLDESETKEAEFYVDVPEKVKPGEYDFYVRVKSKDKTQTIEIPFVILGKPDFKIETINNPPVKQGEKSNFKFMLKNSGNKEAESVSVDIIKDNNVGIEFERYTDFVGDLMPKATGEVYFPFSVQEAAAKKNQVTLSVRYVFEDEVKTKDIPVNINVLKKGTPFYEDPGILTAVLILVVLAVIIGRMILQRR